MSQRGFIAFLQELITMTDPDDERSRRLAAMVLWNIIEMARKTNTVDSITMRLMYFASNDLNRLLEHRDEFAGVPGQTVENRAKRKRLLYALHPEC